MPKVKKAVPVKVKAKPAAKKTTLAPVKVAAPRKSALSVDVYNLEGKKSGTVDLPKEIFNLKASDRLLAQYVRVYLANQRQGTKSTKTRSEVVGSGRKIYKQKGTGRARHGDRQAPIFVGGGVTHAPKSVNSTMKMSKKQRKLALSVALSEKFRGGAIHFASGLTKVTAKTGDLVATLDNMGLGGGASILLIYHDGEAKNLQLASRNLEKISCFPLSSINPYQILKSEKIIFDVDALAILKKRYAD